MTRSQFSLGLARGAEGPVNAALSVDVCPECWALVPTTMFGLHEATHPRPSDDSLTLALNILARMVDPDDCYFDHHGGCQAHLCGLSKEPDELCPMQAAKNLLDLHEVEWR